MAGSAEARLVFDADTAAYNAKMAESRKHTTSLLDGFKEMAGPMLKVASIAGGIELAIEGVKSRWEEWRRQIELAEADTKKLGTNLAATIGQIGLIQSFPEIRKAIAGAAGPLSIEQRTQALGAFAGDLPGLSKDQAIQFVGQSQKAAQVVGPENIQTYARAVALGIQSGLDQKKAGDVAIAVAQSGAHGLEAYERAAGRFAENFPDAKSRSSADFLKYVKDAGPDVFGNRPTQVLGGQALQRQLRGDTTDLLDRQVKVAENIDPTLTKQRQIQATEAVTAVEREKTYGSRAESEAELHAQAERYRANGGAALELNWLRTKEGVDVVAKQYESKNRLAAAQASTPGSEVTHPAISADEIREFHKHMVRNTSPAKGDEKFRNEAQDRDKGAE